MLRKLFISKTNSTRIHLLRSIFASGSSFLVDLSLLKLLVDVFSVYYLLAAAFTFVVGTSINYILSIKWIFKKRSIKNVKIEYIAGQSQIPQQGDYDLVIIAPSVFTDTIQPLVDHKNSYYDELNNQ